MIKHINEGSAVTSIPGLMVRLLMAGVWLSAPAMAEDRVRVVTWNIETVGEQGSPEYQATLAVLARINADVVAVQEVGSDADASQLLNLASDLGYGYTTVAEAGPFGSDRCAFMSDLLMLPGKSWTAAELSGDPGANDLTRYLLSAEVDVSGAGDYLHLVVNHWKSGKANEDEYRRAIESQRIEQLATRLATAQEPYLLMGDVNADVLDAPPTPAVFTALPSGLPADFHTGSDIQALLANGGLPNDPFAPLVGWATLVNAFQLDGSDATRPESGRRLDYLFASPSLTVAGAQVYDCADEGLPGGLPLSGQPLAAATCAVASDHLPVFSEVLVAEGAPPFADVPPSSWAYGYINAIRAAGITGGCGNGNYCPQGLVTREQMAAFLIRAIEGDPNAGYCNGVDPFLDVTSGAWSCPHIKRLAELKITGGCGYGNYCPQGLVTREQMAVFIVRALDGDPAANACNGVAPFNDVPASSWSCGHIQRLVELGITQGCGNGSYCPGNEVTREQMAAYLARAFLGMD